MKNILWAVNPFEESNVLRSGVLSALREFSKRGAAIEPVHVLGPDEFDMNLEFNGPWLKQVRPAVQRTFNHYLKDVELDGLVHPRILFKRTRSITQGARALVAFAKRNGSDLIVVSSHARSGVPRLFLGSFAETLLLESSIPVLVIGPQMKVKPIRKILFPTDLGPKSRAAFKQVLSLAQSFGAEITILHTVIRPAEPIVQSGLFLLGGGYVAWPEYVTSTETKLRRIADHYAALAKAAGVKARVRFDVGPQSVSASVLANAASEKADLITVATEGGAVRSALIGSVARQIVRTAPRPVWVIRV